MDGNQKLIRDALERLDRLKDDNEIDIKQIEDVYYNRYHSYFKVKKVK